MLRYGSLTAHEFHTVCNFDVSDPLCLLIAISGLGKNVGLAVPAPSPTEPALFFPAFLFASPFSLHVKILPLFGLRKNSFLTLLFYRFLPLIGRFFSSYFLFVTADYKCSGAKRHLGCKRKAIKKDWIERVAVLLTIQKVLQDAEIDRIADAIIELQEKEDTTLPSMRQQLA